MATKLKDKPGKARSAFASGRTPPYAGLTVSNEGNNLNMTVNDFVDTMMRNYKIKQRITKLRNAANAINSPAAKNAITAHEDAVKANLRRLHDVFISVVKSKYASGVPADMAFSEGFKAIAPLALAAYEDAKATNPLSAITAALASPQTSI